jgi:type I restriction enzyme S subunit
MTLSKTNIPNPKPSLPRYERYKDSGVEWLGNMPEHWEVEKGKWLFVKMERPVRPEDDVVTAFRDGQVTLRTNRRTEGFTNAIKEHGYQGVRKGDLVINAMDAPGGAIGVSESDGKSTPVYSVCVPRMPDKVNSQFYAYLLRYTAQSGYIATLAKGIRERSTDFRFNDFGALCLPLPAKPEQDRIVAFLDQKTAEIDALIAKKQRQIELLDEQKAILINRAVTRGLNPNAKLKPSGIEWIGEIPEHWEVKKMKFCGYLKGGAGFPPNEQGKTGNELLFFKVGNLGKSEDGRLMADPDSSITRKTAKRLGAHVFPPATIVYAKIGAALLLNRRRMTTDDCCLDNNMTGYVVTSTELLPEWAHRFLSLIDFGTLVNPGPVPSLAEGRQSDIPIVIPSITVQKEILQVLRSQEASIGGVVLKVKEQIKTLQTLRSTLIAHAVTGRIKV